MATRIVLARVARCVPAAAALGLGVALCGAASADWHGGPGGGWHGGPGGGWHGNPGGWRGDPGAWRGGNWYHGWHGGVYGWWWAVPGYDWYAYDAPVYPYPAYPVAPAPAPTGYWYYCANPPGYYPYVQQCAGPWQPVPPSP